MDEPITVGVVIPACRRPWFLAEALAGVLAQTAPVVVDVVVVHDEPEVPPDTPATDGVRHLCTGGGAGASVARNLGAEAARGSHLAFLDDDDRWKPTYLEHVVAAMAGAGASVALTRVEAIVDDKHVPGPPVPLQLDKDVALNRVIGVTGSSIVTSRAAFAAVGGFDPGLRAGNDLDFVVRLLVSGASYVVVPEMLVEHRHHQGRRLTTSPTRREDLEAFRLKWWDDLDAGGRRRLEADVIASQRHAASNPLARAWLTAREVRLIGLGAAVGRLANRRRRSPSPAPPPG